MAEPISYSMMINKRLNELAMITSSSLKMNKHEFIVHSIWRTINDQPSSMALPPHECGDETDELMQINLKLSPHVMSALRRFESNQSLSAPMLIRRAIWRTICLYRTGQVMNDHDALVMVCKTVTRDLAHEEYCECEICTVIAQCLSGRIASA